MYLDALPTFPRYFSGIRSLSQKLHFDEFESPHGGDKPPVVFVLLHGLFGNSRNNRSIAQQIGRLGSKTTGRPFHVILPDLRNHGLSTENNGRAFAAPHTISSAAADLASLVENRLQRESSGCDLVLAGHSLGGKVVLEASRSLGHSALAQTWLLDTNPSKLQEGSTGAVEKTIRAIQAIAVPSQRAEISRHLTEKKLTKDTVLWLVGGLQIVKGSDPPVWTWGFDLDGAVSMYEDYCRRDAWPHVLEKGLPYSVHLMRATRSDRWTNSEDEAAKIRQLERGDVPRSHNVAAAHWLLAEQPDACVQILAKHCFEKLRL